MKVAITIPQMGASIDKAKILRWTKAVGERVADLEPLVEVETSKAVFEIEAEHSGRLVEILHASGTFPIQTVIGYLETDG